MIALEKSIGKDLFHRNARGYSLTEDGERFLSDISMIETAIHPLYHDRNVQTVKISAGSWMTQLLCKHAGRLTHDGINLQFISADHTLDIARREAVIGIRNRRPDQRGLAARLIGQVYFAGYATGPDLPWINVTSDTPSARWLSDQDCGISVNAPRNALDLALEGCGTALLPTFIGDDTGLMKAQTVDILTHDQWLVTHDTERFQPDVRAIIDRLYAVLSIIHKKTIP